MQANVNGMVQVQEARPQPRIDNITHGEAEEDCLAPNRL